MMVTHGWAEAGLVAGVIGVAGEDCSGTVNLFREYDTGKLVRQGNASEREEELRSLAGRGRPSVCGADGEHKALGSVVAQTAEAGSELLGCELLATTVEEDGKGAGAAGLVVQPVEEGVFGFEELGVAGDVAGGAADVVGEEGFRGLGLGAGALRPDCSEGNLHSRL
jgi:hypothetical protein